MIENEKQVNITLVKLKLLNLSIKKKQNQLNEDKVAHSLGHLPRDKMILSQAEYNALISLRDSLLDEITDFVKDE